MRLKLVFLSILYAELMALSVSTYYHFALKFILQKKKMKRKKKEMFHEIEVQIKKAVVDIYVSRVKLVLFCLYATM